MKEGEVIRWRMRNRKYGNLTKRRKRKTKERCGKRKSKKVKDGAIKERMRRKKGKIEVI